jgi:hypothetical protein
MRVKIVPKSKRAKERIQVHGAVMVLVDDKTTAFLVESEGDTWRGEKWKGWFRYEDEADWEEEAV